MKSIVQGRGDVHFAEFTGERIYMREFRKRDGLPPDLSRWQLTIDAMLDGIDTDGPIYLMVDQQRVRAGNMHRRGGVHIDGFWMPEIFTHGSPVPHHSTDPSPRRGNHAIRAAGHGHGTDAKEWPVEAILLASTISACRAWEGNYDGAIGNGGDCSGIDLSGLNEIGLEAGRCYAGNVTMLHESLPVLQDSLRTLVRLNVPGWEPQPGRTA